MELFQSGNGLMPPKSPLSGFSPSLLSHSVLQRQCLRPAGVFAKVNRIVFTQQGNKFGVCDGDGNTALWQVPNYIGCNQISISL